MMSQSVSLVPKLITLSVLCFCLRTIDASNEYGNWNEGRNEAPLLQFVKGVQSREGSQFISSDERTKSIDVSQEDQYDDKMIPVVEESVEDPAIQCNSNQNNSKNRYDSLMCWLYDLKVPIPDEKVRKGILSVSIRDMTCTHFQLNTAESSYSPSNQTSSDDGNRSLLDVFIYGISATCSGKYHSGLTGGTVTVLVESIPAGSRQNPENFKIRAIGDEMSLPFHLQTAIGSTYIKANVTAPMDLPIQHSDNDNQTILIRAPSSAQITACETNIQVPHDGISFSGSVSAKIVELFANSVASHVTKALNSKVCPQLEKLVSDELTSLLKTFDNFLQRLLDGEKVSEQEGKISGSEDFRKEKALEVVRGSEITNTTGEDLLEWNELSTLRDVLTGFNGIINNHLDKGLIITLMEWIGWPGISEKDSSCVDCGFFFRGINGAIRYFTKGKEDKSRLTIQINRDFNFDVQSLGKVTLSMRNVTFEGLDQFKELGLVLPKMERLTNARIAIDKLKTFFEIALQVDPVVGGSLNESFRISVRASDILCGFDSDIGIFREAFKNITIGDLITDLPSDMSVPPWRKILKSVSHLFFPELNASAKIGAIRIDPHNNGAEDVEASLDRLINNVFDLIFNEYDKLTTRLIQEFSSGSGRRAVNMLLRKFLELELSNGFEVSGEDALQPVKNNSSHYFRFNESLAIRKIHDFFASDFALVHVNKFLLCVSSYLSVSSAFRKQGIGHSGVGISIERISFGNIFITDIDALKAVGYDRMEVGVVANELNESLIQIDPSNFSLSLYYPAKELYVSFNATTGADNMNIIGGTRALFDVLQYERLHLYDALKTPSIMTEPYSISSGFYGFKGGIKDISLDLNMNVLLGEDFKNIEYTANDGNLGNIVTNFLLTSSRLLQHIANSMKHMYLCPRSKAPVTSGKEEDLGETGSENPKQAWYILIAVGFVGFHLIFFAPKRQQEFLTKSSSCDPLKNEGSIPSSLIFHEKISHLSRVIVPIIVIGTIAVFIVSNLSTGASVDIRLNKPDGSQLLFIPSITTFSLGKTVREMYHAQVYSLMMLVLVFSGIWPYIKLILMGVAWFIPLSHCSLERREQLLIWLDALGKYSLVDSFVLVLMLVSFKFHIDFPDVGVIDSFVTPNFGFYLFLAGTVFSLVIGHAITFIHRYTSLPQNIHQSLVQESLRSHFFEISSPEHRCPRSVKFTDAGLALWAFITSSCMVLLAIGATRESFVFEFEGLLGNILGDKERSSSYSLISLGIGLPLSVEDPKSLGITVIQYTYFFFALLMPFICVMTIIFLFYVPMTLRKQQVIFMLVEISNAWSAIEVFLLSILASMMELSQFARFMVGNHCDFMKAQFFEKLLDGETTCFNVQSSVNRDVVILFMGVILYNIVVLVGLRLAHIALEERIKKEAECGEESKNVEFSRRTFIEYLTRWNIMAIVEHDSEQDELLANDLGTTFGL